MKLLAKALITFSFIIGMFLSACTNDDNKTDEILTIDLEQIANSEGDVKLSDIVKSISYIPLETNQECFFNPSQTLFRGNWIYVNDRNNGKVFLFDKTGKFIRQIGSIGKGPGQHPGCYTMSATPTGDKVFMLSKKTNWVYCYTIEGDFEFSYRVGYPTWKFATIENDQQIFLSPFGFPSKDSAKFLYYLQDPDGKVQRKYYSSQIVPISGEFNLGRFYANEKQILTHQPFNDTVFEVSQEGEFSPKYHLNFGNNRFPDEVWYDKDNYRKNQFDYFNWLSLVEVNDKVFVRFYSQREYKIGILSLKDGQSTGLKSVKGLLENNLDGGPDFWPSHTDGNNTVYSVLQAVKLVESWSNGDYQNKEFSNKKLHDNFEKLITGLSESDNPVIMVVELK